MEPAKFIPKPQVTTSPVVTVTDRAASELKNAMAQEKETYAGVRLGVAGGCCGVQYMLELAKAAEPGEVAIDAGGVKVFVNPNDQAALQGAKLDFVETPMGAGFHVENPNAQLTGGGHGHGGGGCGCGGHGGGHGHGSGKEGCACGGSGGCGC